MDFTKEIFVKNQKKAAETAPIFNEPNFSPVDNTTNDVSSESVKAAQKTTLDFVNYLRENVGGFKEDAGRKQFLDALQETTLELLAGIKPNADTKFARRQAVIDFGNSLKDKITGNGAKAVVFFATLDYILANRLD